MNTQGQAPALNFMVSRAAGQPDTWAVDFLRSDDSRPFQRLRIKGAAVTREMIVRAMVPLARQMLTAMTERARLTTPVN